MINFVIYAIKIQLTQLLIYYKKGFFLTNLISNVNLDTVESDYINHNEDESFLEDFNFIQHGTKFDNNKRWCEVCNSPQETMSNLSICMHEQELFSHLINISCSRCSAIWPEHVNVLIDKLQSGDIDVSNMVITYH